MSSTVAARIRNLVFLGLAFAVLAVAMYPGRFDGDSITAYQRGLNGQFVDATSVLVSALLGVLGHVAPGPGPMFLLQLAIWIAGLAGFTDALIAAGKRASGQAISLLAVSPLLAFDFFDVQKDALFSALLIALAALGARRLLLAMDTRHNGIFALLPLSFLFWPVRRLAVKPLALSAAAGLAALAASHVLLDVVDHGPLHARRAHFSYSLVTYDLAGIAARTGADASEGRIPDFLPQVRRCYSPHEWDAFSYGPCRPVGRAAQARMLQPATQADLLGVWAREIAVHPGAYAAHRAGHFGCLLSLGCQRQVQAMSAGWWVRPWDEPHMRVSSLARLIGGAANAMWQSPLGAGALWLAVLAAEVIAAAWTLWRDGFRPLAWLALSVSAAGLAYLASFALVGIADQMRYLHPVIFLALVALPPALAGLAREREEASGLAA